jgi:hypothetical protein
MAARLKETAKKRSSDHVLSLQLLRTRITAATRKPSKQMNFSNPVIRGSHSPCQTTLCARSQPAPMSIVHGTWSRNLRCPQIAFRVKSRGSVLSRARPLVGSTRERGVERLAGKAGKRDRRGALCHNMAHALVTFHSRAPSTSQDYPSTWRRVVGHLPVNGAEKLSPRSSGPAFSPRSRGEKRS